MLLDADGIRFLSERRGLATERAAPNDTPAPGAPSLPAETLTPRERAAIRDQTRRLWEGVAAGLDAQRLAQATGFPLKTLLLMDAAQRADIARRFGLAS